MNRVLFLCTGNYYRSRFAEILFNWRAGQQGLPWRAESRGLALDPRNLGPISWCTRQQLTRRGIESPTCERLPQPVCDADFAVAQLIVAVKESEHRPLIEAKFPAWGPRVEYWHVHDLDCAGPDEAIAELELHVLALLNRITQ